MQCPIWALAAATSMKRLPHLPQMIYILNRRKYHSKVKYSIVLEMHFHSPRGAGGNAQSTGDAFLIIEDNQPVPGVEPEGAGGANGDAGAAVGAPFFVTCYILAKR